MSTSSSSSSDGEGDTADPAPASAAQPQQKEKKTRTRASEAQRSHLIKYMESHNIFAKTGLCPGNKGKEGADRMWRKLAEALNAIGPAARSPAAWKQTWHDLKKRIKQKAGNIKRARLKTGGKAPKDDKGRPIPPLTQEEENLFRLCGGDDWVGQDEEEEIGLRQPIKKTKVAAGCSDEDIFEEPLQTHVQSRRDVENFDVENMSFVFLNESDEQDVYVPVCQLGSSPAVSSTENESHQVAPTLSLSTIDSARTQKESQISPEATNSKPMKFARKNERNDKFVAKPGSSKSNEIQDGDKKRKKTPTIRETYEDTTMQYINATNGLAAAYREHTAAINQQTEVLRAHTEAVSLLKDAIPILNEKIHTLGEGLPGAIIQLAQSLKLQARTRPTSYNEENNNMSNGHIF